MYCFPGLSEMDTQTVAVVEKVLFGTAGPTVVPQEASDGTSHSS